jgi:hypothetical protein
LKQFKYVPHKQAASHQNREENRDLYQNLAFHNGFRQSLEVQTRITEGLNSRFGYVKQKVKIRKGLKNSGHQ